MNKKSNLSEAAFNSIYDRMAPKLVAFAISWSGDRVFSEDLVQDAFVQVWQKRHTLKEVEKIDTLLYTIVKNNLINHYHRKLKEQNYLKEIPLGTSNNGHDQDGEQERLQLVNTHLNALPPKSKQVFLMSRKDGLTYQEIARELSISQKSVEKHISKALKILRDKVRSAYLFFF